MKAAQKSQHRSAHGNTHLPKQKMKATLLMKSEGGRKKAKAEWKNLQEVNNENKGQLYEAISFQKWQSRLRSCYPVFLI